MISKLFKENILKAFADIIILIVTAVVLYQWYKADTISGTFTIILLIILAMGMAGTFYFIGSRLGKRRR